MEMGLKMVRRRRTMRSNEKKIWAYEWEILLWLVRPRYQRVLCSTHVLVRILHTGAH
jgi:hypothetical protein